MAKISASKGLLGIGAGATPLREGVFGELGEVLFAFSSGDLAPRWRVVQHVADVLGGLGKRRVHCRSKRVDEVGPPRVVDPQEAPAKAAEVPLHLADGYLIGLALIVEFRVVDGEVLSAFDFQGVRVGPEVDGVAASPGGLAADGAIAGLIRVRRLRLDPEMDCAAVARAFEERSRLP